MGRRDRTFLLEWGGEECGDEIGVGPGCHQARNEFGGSGFLAVVTRIGDLGVGEQMLVVDGDDRQAEFVSDVAGDGFEVGDDEVEAPVLRFLLKRANAAGGVREDEDSAEQSCRNGRGCGRKPGGVRRFR